MANTDITRIAGNIGAMNALNSLENINKQLSIHQSRLQTGKRINSAADDPAGYTIATKMLARSEGLKTALDNISDASNMLSVAEGGLSKMNDILVNMRSKAEQAASDTLGTSERDAISTQLSSYAEQLDNIVNETKWNGTKLLDGTANKQFQTGADVNEVTTWNLQTAHDATSLGVSTVTAADTIANQLGMGVTAQVTTSAKFADLSNLTSGTYSVAVKDVAGGATQGKLTQNGVFSGTAGVSLVANATDNTVGNGTTTGLGAGTVSNGTHTLSISAYTAATTSVDGSVAFSLDGGATVTTTIAANTGIGASIDLGGGVGLKNTNSLAAFSASGSVSFDYIQKDTAKMQLQRSDGSAVAVDANNTDDYTAGPPVVNNTTSSVFYAKSGSNYDTGVGLTIKTGTLGNLQNSANTTVGTLNFQAKSNYTVDVSTAQKASDYMANVNTALDTVNKSMASLGSLMARLDFKSDSVSSAQTNVEASYNRIMNANMAEEQMNASKYSILQQTATAMLAQANQAPQSLLSLFR